MRLKRLELHGFKSFAQKAVFEFPSGTVAIVGPNGSGKSNVIDALRWLLGEREAKNLRGLKADDLIFTGGAGKGRMNVAQASIHFDNSTGFFPVEFAEVAVARKVYRDGTSQYFLNNAEVRLKDIIDFFAGSRLGTKGLTIINQGNSDIFTRASSTERREMIEEVLGLRQFQLKRHEAELKLKNTGMNLEKVRVTVEELLPRLRLLRRQSAKWAERANIEKELRELEHGYFHVKLAVIEREGSVLAPQLVAVDAEIKTREKELAVLRASQASFQQKKPNKGVRADSRQPLFARRAELQRELGRLEAKLEYLAETKEADVASGELVSALKRVRDDLHVAATNEDMASVRRILLDIVQRIDAMFRGKQSAPDGALAEIKKTHASVQAELKKLDSEFAALETAAAKDAEALAEFNKSFQSAFEEVERKKDALVGLQTKANQLRFDRERVEMRREELAARAREAGRTLDEFTGPALGHSRESGNPVLISSGFRVEPGMTSGRHSRESGNPPGMTSEIDFATAERRMLKLRGELAMIGEIDEAMLKEAQEVESRYAFLETQTGDLAKASEDLQCLIAELSAKIRDDFAGALHGLNEHFNNYFRLMFGGGRARLVAVKREKPTVEEVQEDGTESSLRPTRGSDVVIASEAKQSNKFVIARSSSDEAISSDDDDIAGIDID
ncbi:MAG: AAA family ATPase, partial [Candidatus Harrisonbacteria bacterium]|nr:AAA family ATPase [Candidatus Harrisonbacteria bacterium]